MKQITRISVPFAVNTILILAGLMTLFHLLIVSGIIPFQYVWGGRLESHEQMLQFEAFSIALVLIIMGVVAIRGGYIKPIIPMKIIRVIMWMFVGVFILNTLGNLVAIESLESIIATPLTLFLAVLFLRLTQKD